MSFSNIPYFALATLNFICSIIAQLFSLVQSSYNSSQAGLILITPQKIVLTANFNILTFTLSKNHFWKRWLGLNPDPKVSLSCENSSFSAVCLPISHAVLCPPLLTSCRCRICRICTTVLWQLHFLSLWLCILPKLYAHSKYILSAELTLSIHNQRCSQRNWIDSSLSLSMCSPSPFSITISINLPDSIAGTPRVIWCSSEHLCGICYKLVLRLPPSIPLRVNWSKTICAARFSTQCQSPDTVFFLFWKSFSASLLVNKTLKWAPPSLL